MARIDPKTAVATVFVAAMFINIIDATVVNVALPTIAADFGVPIELDRDGEHRLPGGGRGGDPGGRLAR